MKWPALFAVIASVTGAHAQSHPPQYMAVTGIAEGAMLDVRAAPSAEAEIVGDIPPHATGIEVTATDPSGEWGRILWTDGNAWLPMEHLAPAPVATVGETALPAGLQCGGTEPFWTLKLSGANAVYSDLGDRFMALTLLGVRVAEGYRDFPVAMQFNAENGQILSVIAPRPDCTDDMSDRAYPYGLTIVMGIDGLVPQTEAVMAALDEHLPALGLGYADVVKSTTHYVAGDSAEELHDNMAVRNRRYRSPGPASTGVPVHGFADPACRIAVTLTLATD